MAMSRLVLCEEELDGGTLAASNLFVREDNEWRIAHHHAGQIVRRQAERRRPRGSIDGSRTTRLKRCGNLFSLCPVHGTRQLG